MTGVARISFRGGGLFVPVKTPYERQMLFEHIDLYTKLYGHICVEVDYEQWIVRLSSDQPPRCTSCSGTVGLHKLVYELRVHRLCADCARRNLC